MSSAGVVRSTALRAGGACVRCRKGKTKCVYENGRAPCKNCAKGMHECYLPSESMGGASPARQSSATRPARESLPGAPAGPDPRPANPSSIAARASHASTLTEKLTPELIAECERVISKTYPACVVFHKPSFVTQIKNSSLDPALTSGLLTVAARSSPTLIRRYGAHNGATGAADHFAFKTIGLINHHLDTVSLADVQAMCLLIIHEWGSRNAVRAYIYLGQAVRMVQMYRVINSHHAEMTSSERFLEEESLRRVIWMLYIFDCLLTSHPGRQAALSPADTSDVSLPCSDMNFAFGNPVFVKTLAMVNPSHMPAGAQTDVVGEFGHIVLATRIWRDAIQMLMSTTTETFSDATCTSLLNAIEDLRQNLPMQYVEKPGQINLHITMGSGFTYAMLHCMLHCSSVFINRRRLLQYVTAPNFNLEAWRATPQCNELIDRLFTACHGTIGLLTALESGFDKDSIPNFPIVMLFSAFTASATVAYLSLKGLTPPNAVETAAHIVTDGLRFMRESVDTWPLIASWLRHLMVMHRVLTQDSPGSRLQVASEGPQASSVKDEVTSNPDSNNPETMDHDHSANASHGGQHHAYHVGSVSESGRDSEPPAPVSRPAGFAPINGGASAGHVTPSTASPPPPHHEAKRLPEGLPTEHGSNGTQEHVADTGAPPIQDMTARELCTAFERQLLELDDLAAFMGGGV